MFGARKEDIDHFASKSLRKALRELLDTEEPAPDPSDQGGDGFHPEGAGDEAALEAGDEPLAVFDGDDEPDL